jgi:hypothetical protein
MVGSFAEPTILFAMLRSRRTASGGLTVARSTLRGLSLSALPTLRGLTVTLSALRGLTIALSVLRRLAATLTALRGLTIALSALRGLAATLTIVAQDRLEFLDGDAQGGGNRFKVGVAVFGAVSGDGIV